MKIIGYMVPRNIRCNRQKFLSFWSIFSPFSPLKNWKIKIWKLKKTPGDIIILHICTINDNHMMYSSWDMEHERQKFLSFWTIFCPFTPLWTQKIKIFKIWKKQLKVLSFYKCVWLMTVIWCMVPEIWSATDKIFCHFEPFFAALPQQPKKSKFWENERETLRFYHFKQVCHKWQSYDVWFLRYKAWLA